MAVVYASSPDAQPAVRHAQLVTTVWRAEAALPDDDVRLRQRRRDSE